MCSQEIGEENFRKRYEPKIEQVIYRMVSLWHLWQVCSSRWAGSYTKLLEFFLMVSREQLKGALLLQQSAKPL